MGAESIRVVIVDDHPVVRAGLRLILDSTRDIQVVAEGAAGSDAIQLVDQYDPDILILDINLPDMNGVEAARQLLDRGKPTAILALTIHNDDQTIFKLLELGVKGYVLKDDALETLTVAIRAIAAGGNWLSPSITRHVVNRAFGKEHTPIDTTISLTPRELEVLCLVARGLDNGTIARHLTLAQRTVQNHICAIYGKLGVNTRAEAILYAIRNNLVEVNRLGTDNG
jgi:two-component system response regulator DegU